MLGFRWMPSFGSTGAILRDTRTHSSAFCSIALLVSLRTFSGNRSIRRLNSPLRYQPLAIGVLLFIGEGSIRLINAVQCGKENHGGEWRICADALGPNGFLK